MIEPVVRRATEDDAEQLERLEGEARHDLVGRRGGDRWLTEHPERGDRWGATVAADEVFVAVIDGVVVGYLVGHVAGPIATVGEVFVHPEARECGFGTALLEAALGRFVELGASEVDAFALPGDRETKNLYERAGIIARLITLSAPLPSPLQSAPKPS